MIPTIIARTGVLLVHGEKSSNCNADRTRLCNKTNSENFTLDYGSNRDIVS